MKDTARPWAALAQLRATLWLSVMPALLAVFGVLTGQFGMPGPAALWVLFVAWASFVIAVYLPALVLGRTLGPDYQLRTRVVCPRCAGSSPIICLRCTHCSQDLGVPVASRHTYTLTMLGYGVFLAALYLRPDPWW